MNGQNISEKNHNGNEFFLSEISGIKVKLNGSKIGKLEDLVIVETGKIPEVTSIKIKRPAGKTSLLLPWTNVKIFSTTEIEVSFDATEIDNFLFDPSKDHLLLKDYVLDKKVIDIEDREVEVVYDIKLILRNNKLYVSDVDLSKYGLLRRIGLKKLANFIYKNAEDISEEIVSWTYIQTLPTQLSSFKGNVKLNILKEKLSEMHPVDLADIIEELEPEQRITIFEGLDSEQASDILEEIDPNVQRDLVISLRREKVIELINEMTPAQAADLLAVLPVNERDEILLHLDKEDVEKITASLNKQEESILNLTTTEFIQFPPTMTVADAIKEYRKTAEDKDFKRYIYVVSPDKLILGVIDLPFLLCSPDHLILLDIMVENVIKLENDCDMKEATIIFSRYGFRAIPIVDKTDKILGVVTYRDMMNLKHRIID
ncbi:MAG: magnesium transporter [Ignavibacteriales bacterium]|nr:MAG: magnesium transporter [Ignavibacteriales bacterium]